MRNRRRDKKNSPNLELPEKKKTELKDLFNHELTSLNIIIILRMPE